MKSASPAAAVDGLLDHKVSSPRTKTFTAAPAMTRNLQKTASAAKRFE